MNRGPLITLLLAGRKRGYPAPDIGIEDDEWWHPAFTAPEYESRDDWRRPYVIQPAEREGKMGVSDEIWEPAHGGRSCD